MERLYLEAFRASFGYPQLAIADVYCLSTVGTQDAVFSLFLYYNLISDRYKISVQLTARRDPSTHAKYKIEHEFIFGAYFASSPVGSFGS